MAELFLINNLISEFFLTRIKKHYLGDTFFPLKLLKNWNRLIVQQYNDFTIYKYTNNFINNY